MAAFRLIIICMILKCIIVDNLATANNSTGIHEKDALKLMEMEIRDITKRNANNGKR